jgi:hypothetical protein
VQLDISSKASLVIKGGYVGSGAGTPGDTTNETSVILQSGSNVRVLYVATATVAVERLTFSGGNFTGAGDGCGLYLLNSGVALTNCIIRNNTTYTANNHYGGGIYASGGSLTLVGTYVTNNYAGAATTAADLSGAGGGLYGLNVDLYITNCVFLNNRAISEDSSGLRNMYAWGGGICLGGGSALIVDSTISSNYCRSTSRQWGGGAAFNNVSPVIRNTSLHGNYVYPPNSTLQGGHTERGSAIYVQGSSLVALSNCPIVNNYVRINKDPADGTCGYEAILVDGASAQFSATGCVLTNNQSKAIEVINSGRVYLDRCLIAGNTNGGVYFEPGGAGNTLGNVTIARNGNWGLYASGGSVLVSNSIVWSNSSGGISGATSVNYSYSQERWAGIGNVYRDPLFVDPTNGNYHLKSTSGSLHGGAWAFDDADSPCIDAGDPSDPRWVSEPPPNKKRINLGFYGGTPEASKSYTVYGTRIRTQ